MAQVITFVTRCVFRNWDVLAFCIVCSYPFVVRTQKSICVAAAELFPIIGPQNERDYHFVLANLT